MTTKTRVAFMVTGFDLPPAVSCYLPLVREVDHHSDRPVGKCKENRGVGQIQQPWRLSTLFITEQSGFLGFPNALKKSRRYLECYFSVLFGGRVQDASRSV